MRLSFIFLHLISIINTLRGVQGEQEKTSEDLHIKFEKHIEFEDDWEDDFYHHFKDGKSDKDEQRQDDQLWIDWSDIDEEEFAEALEIDVEEISAELEADSEEDDDQVSETDSFVTARDQTEAGDLSEDNEEGLLNFDDDYTFIEGISDSDSDSSLSDDTDDEFYKEAMGNIADCFETESDLDSEAQQSPTSIIQDKLIPSSTGATGETAEVAGQKWESLSEENWKEFGDSEEAVFDFIATAIAQSITKQEVAPKTEDEILMQV